MGVLRLVVYIFFLVRFNCIILDLLYGECILFFINVSLSLINEWMCY